MAMSARSAATERAYLQFAPPPHGAVVATSPVGTVEEFDESDIWGSFSPAVSDAAMPADPSPRARQVPAAARPAGRKQAKPVAVGRAAHGSLPVNIPDWSKILGDEYRGHHPAAGDWELDDADDEDVDAGAAAVVPPHELAWRRRAASLSVHEAAGVVGRTLKVRDAVWKRTTGFQD